MRKLRVVVAAGWLVVGFAAADAASPAQEIAVAVDHAADEPGPPAYGTEASGPSLHSPERPTGREPEKPAAASSLLLPGRMVRVHRSSVADDPDEQLKGTLLDADETFLRISADDRVVTVPRQDIRRLEVAMGQERRTWMWLGIGAAIGSGVGFVAGFGSTGCTFTSCPISEREANTKVLVGIALGAAAGAGVGAAIGHSIERATGWTDMPMERVHVILVPTSRHGFRLALTVGF